MKRRKDSAACKNIGMIEFRVGTEKKVEAQGEQRKDNKCLKEKCALCRHKKYRKDSMTNGQEWEVSAPEMFSSCIL